MAETKIEWADYTFNPWRGCQKVSPGCEHCYADTMSKRNPGTLGVWGPNGTRVVAAESYWRLPVKWDKLATCNCGAAGTGGVQCEWCKAGCPRPRVFCASLADVFEDWQGRMVDAQGDTHWHNGTPVPVGASTTFIPFRPSTMDDVRQRLFKLIDATPNLDWLLVTKRPENVARCLARYGERIDTYAAEAFSTIWNRRVWLGTSVENQATADERIPQLLRVPAAVRFLSMEPLLGPVDLVYAAAFSQGSKALDGLNWVIVGGESGPQARPCNIEWIRSIVRQCKAAGVPCFVKQLGANVRDRNDAGFMGDPGDSWDVDPFSQVEHDPDGVLEQYQGAPVRVLLSDRKGGDPSEWPADLRVRELPETVTTGQ
mgnify:CR=1 FL=1